MKLIRERLCIICRNYIPSPDVCVNEDKCKAAFEFGYSFGYNYGVESAEKTIKQEKNNTYATFNDPSRMRTDGSVI
jgi:hypothetical protein